jgi:Ca2+-binding EF-hand superfamily protein
LEKFGKQNGKTKIIGMKRINTVQRDQLALIKEKLKTHMLKKQWNLNNLIAIFTGNRAGKAILATDFSNALKGILSMEESILLFTSIDVDNSKDVSKEEILSELAILNAALIFEELKITAETAEMKVKEVFDSVDADRNDKLDIDEFSKLIDLMVSSKDENEIEMLFAAVDKTGKGHISREDFNFAMTQKQMDLSQSVKINPGDILRPLSTKISVKMSTNSQAIFQRYATGGVFSFDAFRTMIETLLGIELWTDEL